MRKLLFLILLLGPAGSRLWAAEPQAQPDSATAAAWDDADRQYRASYFYCVAVAAELRGQVGDSLALLKRASEADPQSLYLLQKLAELSEQAGQMPEARAALAKALSLAPSDMDLRQKSAQLAVQAGATDDARRLFLGPHGEEPKDRASLKALAAMDMAERKWDAAASRLKAILAQFPPALDEKEMLAEVLQKQDRKAEAAALYEEILVADPGRSESAYQLSHLDEDLGQDTQALATLQRAVKASPESSVLQDALARCLYRQKKYGEAEAAFSKLAEANPEDTDSLLYRGMARLQAKKYKEAEGDFLALEKLGQDNPSQLYGLGLAQLLQERQGEAEQTFKKLLGRFPKAVPGYTELAYIYDRTSRTAEAMSLLEKGVAQNPDIPDLYLLLGSADMDAGQMKKAEGVFQDGLKATDNDSGLRFQLAVLYDKNGQFDKAEAGFKQLIADEPKNAQALNYLGYSYVDRGIKLDEAEALIRRALAVEPENPYYQDSLGWACYKLGRFEDARNFLSKAVQVEDPGPDEAVVFEHLGEVDKKLGDEKAAQSNFDKAAQLKSGSGSPQAGHAGKTHAP